jgi:hypothetical protein
MILKFPLIKSIYLYPIFYINQYQTRIYVFLQVLHNISIYKNSLYFELFYLQKMNIFSPSN